MPYLTNLIGPYEFTALLGLPVLPQERNVIDDRAGVDGSEIILQGLKGEPFALISQVDCASYAAAWEGYKLYTELTAEDAQELVVASVSSLTFDYKVKVLRVEAVNIARISGAVGNKFNANPGGWLECRWDLIAIPLPITGV